MRIVCLIALACLAAGCGTDRPITAGGKAVSYWLGKLQDADAKERATAVRKLGNVGAADAAVLPALLGALKDRDAAVRCEAILALLKCGPDAREALPALAEARDRDPSRRVRDYASKAVDRLRTEK
jgi:hypothetical protein